MDERVLTAEGRAALVVELCEERTRGPQPAHTSQDPVTAAVLSVIASRPRDVPSGAAAPGRAVPSSDLASFAAQVAAYALTLPEVDPARWQDSGVCVIDPRSTNGETPAQIARARIMCAACLVRRQCEQWADADPEFVGFAAGYLYGDSRAKSRRQEVA